MAQTPPKTLTLDQVISRKPAERTVKLDGLGGKVTVRQFVVGDQMWIAEKMGTSENEIEVLIWTIIRCTIEPAFEESNFEDLKQLPVSSLVEWDLAIAETGGEAATVKAAEKSDLAES